MQARTLIIAEAGVNHNGDIEKAKALIIAAKAAGADIVKFQTFKASNLVTEDAEMAEYQKQNTGSESSQYQMLKSLELSYEQFKALQDFSMQMGIVFLSTAFDFESLAFLDSELNLPLFKIPSGELTNAPFVLAHARLGKPLIVSTGMADIEEIERALSVIAFGYLFPNDDKPSIEKFEQAIQSEAGLQILKEKVTVLHCTTEYPTPLGDVNLRAMQTLEQTFNVNVGYSDHTEGVLVPSSAVALGATIIEKHFTLDKTLPGPDHKASLEPDELKLMVDNIRQVEQILGTPTKQPAASELKNKEVARKSIVASRDISQGQNISEDDVAILRPGGGLSPEHYWQIIGQVSQREYKKGDYIQLEQ